MKFWAGSIIESAASSRCLHELSESARGDIMRAARIFAHLVLLAVAFPACALQRAAPRAPQPRQALATEPRALPRSTRRRDVARRADASGGGDDAARQALLAELAAARAEVAAASEGAKSAEAEREGLKSEMEAVQRRSEERAAAELARASRNRRILKAALSAVAVAAAAAAGIGQILR